MKKTNDKKTGDVDKRKDAEKEAERKAEERKRSRALYAHVTLEDALDMLHELPYLPEREKEIQKAEKELAKQPGGLEMCQLVLEYAKAEVEAAVLKEQNRRPLFELLAPVWLTEERLNVIGFMFHFIPLDIDVIFAPQLKSTELENKDFYLCPLPKSRIGSGASLHRVQVVGEYLQLESVRKMVTKGLVDRLYVEFQRFQGPQQVEWLYNLSDNVVVQVAKFLSAENLALEYVEVLREFLLMKHSLRKTGGAWGPVLGSSEEEAEKLARVCFRIASKDESSKNLAHISIALLLADFSILDPLTRTKLLRYCVISNLSVDVLRLTKFATGEIVCFQPRFVQRFKQDGVLPPLADAAEAMSSFRVFAQMQAAKKQSVPVKPVKKESEETAKEATKEEPLVRLSQSDFIDEIEIGRETKALGQHLKLIQRLMKSPSQENQKEGERIEQELSSVSTIEMILSKLSNLLQPHHQVEASSSFFLLSGTDASLVQKYKMMIVNTYLKLIQGDYERAKEYPSNEHLMKRRGDFKFNFDAHHIVRNGDHELDDAIYHDLARRTLQHAGLASPPGMIDHLADTLKARHAKADSQERLRVDLDVIRLTASAYFERWSPPQSLSSVRFREISDIGVRKLLHIVMEDFEQDKDVLNAMRQCFMARHQPVDNVKSLVEEFLSSNRAAKLFTRGLDTLEKMEPGDSVLEERLFREEAEERVLREEAESLFRQDATLRDKRMLQVQRLLRDQGRFSDAIDRPFVYQLAIQSVMQDLLEKSDKAPNVLHVEQDSNKTEARVSPKIDDVERLFPNEYPQEDEATKQERPIYNDSDFEDCEEFDHNSASNGNTEAMLRGSELEEFDVAAALDALNLDHNFEKESAFDASKAKDESVRTYSKRKLGARDDDDV